MHSQILVYNLLNRVKNKYEPSPEFLDNVITYLDNFLAFEFFKRHLSYPKSDNLPVEFLNEYMSFKGERGKDFINDNYNNKVFHIKSISDEFGSFLPKFIQFFRNSYAAGKGWILRKHIIPNTLGPILVNVTLTIPRAIFAEATLGFLGLGLQAPKSSLGTLANDGLAGLAVGNTYQIFIPAILISLIMFSFNVLGDGLRDSLDPRLRK